MNCFKGRKGNNSSTGNTPSDLSTIPDHQPQNPQQDTMGCHASPDALDAVIDHRVLPLFFRTLRSWTSSSPPSMRITNKRGYLLPFDGHMVEVVEAVATGIKLRSWHRKDETAAHGAVESLVSFLRTVRRAAKSTGGSDELKDDNPFRQGMDPLIDASRAALDAVGIMCSSSESAREKVVALGFHSDVVILLAEEVGAMEENGNSSGVLLEGLRIVRNLGRSSVPCSSIIGVGALETLIKVVAIATEGGGEGEERRMEDLGLAVSGLANMVLEHDVVKETISRSECLRTVCKTAIDTSAPEHVGQEKYMVMLLRI